MINATLAVQHVRKTFIINGSTIPVLDDINVTFLQSATYALTGKSGCGKSTLLYILARLSEPSEGTVVYTFPNGHGTQQPPQGSIGVVFQKSYYIDELSVIENVMLPGLIANIAYDNCLARAQELLRYVDLLAYQQSPIGALSGGQQQRVQLARALFARPLFLIADEPTSSLDAANSQQIMQLLLDCHQQWNMGIIISTHSPSIAQQMQHHYRLEDGLLIT